MTHGDGEPGRRIRIRVTGDDAQDLEALYRWLSLEDWFAQAEAAHQLKAEVREYDGARHDPEERRDGPPMSGGLVELVLVIAGAAITPVFEDLYNRAKVAAHAWADNSSSDDHPMVTDVQADGAGDGVDGVDGDGDGDGDGDDAANGGNGADDTDDADEEPEDDEGGRNT
ncbi:hypothetical protein [Streptomyces sp. NPDC008139]|uniref:hypothetical protein n=1 Tax=Streptomyces sp. NPDC008139 TaxID=3364814 RepID=UPI0036E33D6C